jgi:YbbR domain-containing protein
MDKIYKKESIVIFSCIIILLLVYCLYLIVNKIKNYYNKNTETFNNNSKRSKMIRMYKNDNILDPDEDPDDESDDPDSTRGRDPDS